MSDYPVTVMTDSLLDALEDGDTGSDKLGRKWVFNDGYVTREDGCEWNFDTGHWHMVGPIPAVVKIAAELAGVTYEDKFSEIEEGYVMAVSA
jgi:hypothetical protein